MNTWFTQTKQFGKDEVQQLQHTSFIDLAVKIAQSDPIVALRALAEVLLNETEFKAGEDSKLLCLLEIESVNKRWRACVMNGNSDPRDIAYMFFMIMAAKHLKHAKTLPQPRIVEIVQGSIRTSLTNQLLLVNLVM